MSPEQIHILEGIVSVSFVITIILLFFFGHKMVSVIAYRKVKFTDANGKKLFRIQRRIKIQYLNIKWWSDIDYDLFFNKPNKYILLAFDTEEEADEYINSKIMTVTTTIIQI